MTIAPSTTAGPQSEDDSRCGRCGYLVKGLSGFTCPECGGDLREVGIVVPGRVSWRVKRLIAAIPFRRVAHGLGFVIFAGALFAAPTILLARLLPQWIVSYEETNTLRLYGKVDITFSATGRGFVLPTPKDHLRIDYTAAEGTGGSADVDLATMTADLTDPRGPQRVAVDPGTLCAWKFAIDGGHYYADNAALSQQMHQIIRSARSANIAEYKDAQWEHVYGSTSHVSLTPPWLPRLAAGLWLPLWALLIFSLFRRLLALPAFMGLSLPLATAAPRST